MRGFAFCRPATKEFWLGYSKEKIGTIAVGGFYTLEEGITLSEEEKIAIINGCKKVYELPSEYGCFGVGESPTEPFDERRLPGCIILAK